MGRLFREIITDPSNSELTHPLVRLLASRHQLPNCVTFSDDSLNAIAALCQNSLLEAVSKNDPLALQSAMDCCSLVGACTMHRVWITTVPFVSPKYLCTCMYAPYRNDQCLY